MQSSDSEAPSPPAKGGAIHKDGSKPPALVLVNLGSPDSPTKGAVRRYLAQFLHDKRIVNTTRWIWCPILHGIILRTRPARSAAKYAKVWDQPEGAGGEEGAEGREAPLVRITRAQGHALQARLGDAAHVEIAMRYGNPSIDSVLTKLVDGGFEQIAVLPLYPQYSATTTASVEDAIRRWLRRGISLSKVETKVKMLGSYFDHPLYIAALKDSLVRQFKQATPLPDIILTSFHGIPQSYADAGDPYPGQCARTVELLRAALGEDAPPLRLTYQSRFGPKAWLTPYTDKELEELAAGGSGSGKSRVMIITPGFAADCLETLEEIDIEAREVFMTAGGGEFIYVACLNESPAHIDLLETLAREQLLPGWFDQSEHILRA